MSALRNIEKFIDNVNKLYDNAYTIQRGSVYMAQTNINIRMDENLKNV